MKKYSTKTTTFLISDYLGLVLKEREREIEMNASKDAKILKQT